ncbi:MAG: hypothetical protein HY814_02305 [Candidatus Riflebacteria bacterium]|nr:hypothetical protein [Candidatus Riflebacteria bacterium]
MHIRTSLVIALGLVASTGGLLAGPPTEVLVANLDAVSFTVTWCSATAEEGQVLFAASREELQGRKGTFRIAEDDRGPGTRSRVHHVTLGPARSANHQDGGEGSLSPDTEYFLEIVSGGQAHADQGGPYRVKTPSLLTPRMVAQDLVGTAGPAKGTAAATDCLVFATISSAGGESQLLSAVASNGGQWDFPLGTIRGKSLDAYFDVAAGARCNLRYTTAAEATRESNFELQPGPEVFTPPASNSR